MRAPGRETDGEWMVGVLERARRGGLGLRGVLVVLRVLEGPVVVYARRRGVGFGVEYPGDAVGHSMGRVGKGVCGSGGSMCDNASGRAAKPGRGRAGLGIGRAVRGSCAGTGCAGSGSDGSGKVGALAGCRTDSATRMGVGNFGGLMLHRARGLWLRGRLLVVRL